MEKGIKEFCLSCLHYHINDQKVNPRPFGEAVHGGDKNKVLHFDFISMHQLTPKSKKHLYKYVLILNDDFSGFVELVPTTRPDHFTVQKASWIGANELEFLRLLSVIKAHISWTRP